MATTDCIWSGHWAWARWTKRMKKGNSVLSHCFLQFIERGHGSEPSKFSDSLWTCFLRKHLVFFLDGKPQRSGWCCRRRSSSCFNLASILQDYPQTSKRRSTTLAGDRFLAGPAHGHTSKTFETLATVLEPICEEVWCQLMHWQWSLLRLWLSWGLPALHFSHAECELVLPCVYETFLSQSYSFVDNLTLAAREALDVIQAYFAVRTICALFGLETDDGKTYVWALTKHARDCLAQLGFPCQTDACEPGGLWHSEHPAELDCYTVAPTFNPDGRSSSDHKHQLLRSCQSSPKFFGHGRFMGPQRFWLQTAMRENWEKRRWRLSSSMAQGSILSSAFLWYLTWPQILAFTNSILAWLPFEGCCINVRIYCPCGRRGCTISQDTYYLDRFRDCCSALPRLDGALKRLLACVITKGMFGIWSRWISKLFVFCWKMRGYNQLRHRPNTKPCKGWPA